MSFRFKKRFFRGIFRMVKNKIIILCLLSAVFLNRSSGQSYSRLQQTYPLPKITMERLGETSLGLARQKLAANSKDPMGMLLLNFANHFIPTSRDVLLVRGKLKFKVPLNAPKRKVDEKEFLTLLCRARDYINDSDTAMNRHILIILNQLIRSINPRDEDAIIALMEFSDKGENVDINKLLTQRLDTITDTRFDPKDSRYVISDIKKTIMVPANVPWTDTWIKIKAGKMISVTAHGTWSMGDKLGFPACDPEGYTTYDVTKIKRWSDSSTTTAAAKKKKKTSNKVKRSGAPGCLLAKIGTKEYYVGSQAVFKAENDGILYFGPYEWDDYLDNDGSLSITVEISD